MKKTARQWIKDNKIGGWNWEFKHHCNKCGGEFPVQGFKRADGIDEIEESTECKICGSEDTVRC